MFKKIFIHSPVKYIIGFVLMLGIPTAYLFIQKGWDLLIEFSNAFFIGGLTILMIGLIVLVDFFGGFDIFRYMFVRREPNGTKKTLYDYKLQREEKLKPYKFEFVPYVTIGLISLLISFIIKLFA